MEITQTDIRALAELVAEYCREPEVIRTTIPARNEIVTETVMVEEPSSERVPDIPVGFFAKILRWLRIAIAFAAFGFGAYMGFAGTFFVWMAKLVSRKDRGPSLVENLRRSWQQSNENYEAALLAIRTRLETTTHEVEQTVERVKEIEPERTVEETITPSRVVALGRGRIEFRALNSLGGNVVIGPAALMDAAESQYPTVSEVDRLMAAVSEMESSLEHVPWVLDGDPAGFEVRADTAYGDNLPLRGLEREIKEHLEEMERAFSGGQSVLTELLAVTDPKLLRTMLPISDQCDLAAPWIQAMTELAESTGGRELETFAEKWISRWGQVDQALVQVREESLIDQIAPECLNLGTSLSYTAFNFYCPRCNADKLEELRNRDYRVQDDEMNEPVNFSVNTRCQLDAKTKLWRCVGCEHETSNPVPVHKMQDGILMPAFDRLMDEHRVERVKAHQDVRSREIEIRNAMEGETERVEFANDDKVDALLEEMQRLSVDISGERQAIDMMAEILAAYDVKQNAVMGNIREEGIRTGEAIQARTEAVLERVDQVKNDEMAALQQELFTLSRAKREDDERRDAVQKQIAHNIRDVETAVHGNTAAVHVNTLAVEAGALSTRSGLDRIESEVEFNNAISHATLRATIRRR